MTLVQKMFLFWRGQTLSCPLPWWRHSWYRPVVIVYPHKPQPSRPHPYSSRWTQTSQTSTLTHPAHRWMMTPSKYNHSNTDTAINCPTYSTSSNGASITLQRERARLKTHEQHYLYTEDTVTVRGWPRMDRALLVGVKCTMKSSFIWRRTTNNYNKE